MAKAHHSIIAYALSTCAHCKKAVALLKEIGADFDCIYVDTLEGQQRSETLTRVREHNPRISFPTIVLDGGERVIVGFQPDAIREALAV